MSDQHKIESSMDISSSNTFIDLPEEKETDNEKLLKKELKRQSMSEPEID